MSLNKQIWTNQLMKNFYPEASFLNYAKDFTTLVEYDKLHLAEVGTDPDVLINNTTYPIAVTQRTDTPLEIELDLFETENTLVRYPEAIELAYDKVESVISGHKDALRFKTGTKAAHAFTPNEDSSLTPVITTTGDDNGEGKKRVRVEDILLLKRRYDLLNIPSDKRYLVLDPRHTEDLILFDLKAFKDIADFENGKPKRFAGFNMLEFSGNALFDPATMKKIPFGAVEPSGASFCSFSFYSDEVMKADGSVKMYSKIDDPEERATIIGFDKRFVALPIRYKGIGAIVAANI